MDSDTAYGLSYVLLGGIVLMWGIYARRLPVPFLRLSASDERLWYRANMFGAGLAILVGLWLIVR